MSYGVSAPATTGTLDLISNEDFNKLEHERALFTPGRISGVAENMPQIPVIIVPQGTFIYRGFGGSVQPPDCDLKRTPVAADFAFESPNYADRELWFGPRATAVDYCAKSSTQVVYAETKQAEFTKCRKGGNYVRDGLPKDDSDDNWLSRDTLIPLYYISGSSGILVKYETTRPLVLLDVGYQKTIQALADYKHAAELRHNTQRERRKEKYKYEHEKLPWQLSPFTGKWFGDIEEEYYKEGSDKKGEPLPMLRDSTVQSDMHEAHALCSSIEGIDGWIHFDMPTLKPEIALCTPKTAVRMVSHEDATGHIEDQYAKVGLPSQSEFRIANAGLRRKVNELFANFKDSKTIKTDQNSIRLSDSRLITNFY